MSDNLKKDILKAIQDSKNKNNDTLKNTVDNSIVLKKPQILQHSFDESLKLPEKLGEKTK